MAPFTFQGDSVGVGQTGFHVSHASGVSTQTAFSFDIARDMRSAVRVTYGVLQSPQREVIQNVTIVMIDASPGVFAATTADTVWIEILSVQPL